MAYDPLESHPIHSALKQLADLTKSSQLNDLNEEIDDRRRWYIDHILVYLGEAERRISRLTKYIVNLNSLNNLANSADAIRSQLENYVSNKNQDHIDNAFNQLEQGFAVQLQQVAIGDMAPLKASDALNDFRETSRSAIGELKANAGITRRTIGEIDQKIAEGSEQFEAIKASIESEKVNMADAMAQMVTNQEGLFSELGQRFEAAEGRWETSAASKITSLEETGKYYLSELAEKRKEAAKIVQSVGDILTTGTYKATAENEGKLANRYRVITIALFSIGIFIVISNYIFHLLTAWGGEPLDESPWMIASRFATAIAVALPAVYTARESARHRTTADRARQRELELTTLGPFIELLPSEKKEEIRDRLTDRYFGGEIDNHEIPSPIDADKITKLVEAIAKLKG